MIIRLKEAGIRVSLFIEPVAEQLDCAVDLGAQVVELHTGLYCDSTGNHRAEELRRIERAADHAEKVGLECHAGHGLNFDTVASIAAIPTIAELNIGHFLIGEGIFSGLDAAVREMRRIMIESRTES